MNSRRKSQIGLSESRIYQRGRKFYYFSRHPIQNPKTGKVAKWHQLCDISEGQLRARVLAADLLKDNRPAVSAGDLPEQMRQYRLHILKLREKDRPTEEARIKLFNDQNKEIRRVCDYIAESFADFDTDQVLPSDIARFVDRWEGQRTAQVYHSRLNGFFKWAIRRGLRTDNPVENVTVAKPAKRKVYITDEQWHAVRGQLKDEMIRCYVDLCFLLYQRTTDVRLLKWAQIDEQDGLIHVTPTKTEESSGIAVAIPISPALRDVLKRARKAAAQPSSPYVIHSRTGGAYTKTGIWSPWRDACIKAGVKSITLRDIRAKAATDAKRAGYSRADIQIGLAHADPSMTDHYLRGREIAVSTLQLELPKPPAS